MDRISSLPDQLLCHILQFLAIKESALTSLLSKRWRNLFALTPNLDLCFVDYNFWKSKGNGSFIRFVDRVLDVSRGNHTISKFSLKLRQRVESDHINRWMINVLSRGILDLTLDIRIGNLIALPFEIFTCNTIVKLKLESLIDINATVHKNIASLPALKTLFLCCIRFPGFAFETLLSGCLVLEELTVLGDPWDWKHFCRRVSSSTLKRFIIRCKDSRNLGVSRSISFDTPNLVYLDYRDDVADEYPTVNLNSLVEAKICLSIDSPGKSNPTNLIKGLRNVEILYLLSHETSEIFYSFGEAIPVFENLSRLSIATAMGTCWEYVRLLLKKTPNLETPVIKGYLHYYDEYVEEEPESLCECLSEYSFLCSCSVKVLEITKYRGTKGDLKQMKLILEKSPCLELVKVRACEETELTFDKDLPMLIPIAAEIQLELFPFVK